MSIVAGTLANGGVCPTTGKRIFSASTVKNCLSLMYSCGMYDFSGEFAFSIGLPAKSGVSGAVIVVVPNVLGLCIWSPRLDELGNSVRGIDFCKELVKKYNFHNYDSLIDQASDKKDPRHDSCHKDSLGVFDLCWAASRGDIDYLQKMLARGFDLNKSDYDGRSALHLAASEGQIEVVKFLLSHNVDYNKKDRWGGTALDDAQRENHSDIIKLLSTLKQK